MNFIRTILLILCLATTALATPALSPLRPASGANPLPMKPSATTAIASAPEPDSNSTAGKWIRLSGRAILLVSILGMGTGLFFWLRPEGIFTPRSASSVTTTSGLNVRVLSWNVLQSESKMLGGPWADRKDSFRILLEANPCDIICMQEALPEQIAFFTSVLPGHSHYAIGRDDGKASGEHCPIFFNSNKYNLLASGTFWLSPTPEIPSRGWGENVPRLCSWVELEDHSAGSRFRVYNLHLHLHPLAQPKGARVMEAQLKGVEIPCIITGDFNAPHRWPALQVLERRGFTNAETSGALTYHIRGKGIRCLDHILTDSQWHVAGGGLLKEKGGKTYPSDHFGLWADLALR